MLVLGQLLELEVELELELRLKVVSIVCLT